MTPRDIQYFAYSLELNESVRVGNTMMNKREGFLVRMSEGGHVGWGDAAPLDGYGQDTREQVLKAITEGSTTPTLSFALDCASRNLQARLQGLTLADSLGECRRNCLQNTALSVAGDAAGNTLKWKVGSEQPEVDAHRINGFMMAHPHVSLRLDANGMWDREGALKFADLITRWHSRIEFVEEPWKDCFESDNRRNYPLPMAIDESLKMCDWRRADVVVLKPALIGALEKSMDMASSIQESGREVYFSSAFESFIGMSAIIAVASRFKGGAVGFGTYRFIRRDVGPRVAAFDRDVICLADFSERDMIPDLRVLKELKVK